MCLKINAKINSIKLKIYVSTKFANGKSPNTHQKSIHSGLMKYHLAPKLLKKTNRKKKKNCKFGKLDKKRFSLLKDLWLM